MVENNKKVLDLIYTSIMSEGGDGDAIWLSKHTSLDDLRILMEEYDLNNNTGWEIEAHDNCLVWGRDEEWAIITCDEDTFNKCASYIILKINY
jgi:hypothetical protein